MAAVSADIEAGSVARAARGVIVGSSSRIPGPAAGGSVSLYGSAAATDAARRLVARAARVDRGESSGLGVPATASARRVRFRFV
jgi:hypothetical protein